jgi:predicted O-methyltransferase YrrM
LGLHHFDNGVVMADERTRRIREVRHRLLQDGPRSWELFEEFTVPARDCDLIRDLLIAERAETVVEVGLCYASSALAIGEALVTVAPPEPRHLIIDPYQESRWANAGRKALERAGLDALVSLIPVRSSVAVPKLIAEGVVADAAFVDGDHRFHQVMLDLTLLQEVVRPGGLVLIDDYWASSVRTAVHYFVLNLGWNLIPDAFAGGSLIFVDEDEEKDLVARCAALRLPKLPVERRFEDLRPFWPGSVA